MPIGESNPTYDVAEWSPWVRAKRWLNRKTARWRAHHPWPVSPRSTSEEYMNRIDTSNLGNELGRLVCLRCGRTIRRMTGTSDFDATQAFGFGSWWCSASAYKPIRGCRGYRR